MKSFRQLNDSQTAAICNEYALTASNVDDRPIISMMYHKYRHACITLCNSKSSSIINKLTIIKMWFNEEMHRRPSSWRRFPWNSTRSRRLKSTLNAPTETFPCNRTSYRIHITAAALFLLALHINNGASLAIHSTWPCIHPLVARTKNRFHLCVWKLVACT